MRNYYRRIVALFPKKQYKLFKKSQVAFHLRNLLLVVFILTVLFQIQVLVFLSKNYQSILREKESRLKEYSYWEDIAGQFPNIPDILYNAALSSANIGRYDDAINYLDKALKLDPLFEDAIQLQKKLVKG